MSARKTVLVSTGSEREEMEFELDYQLSLSFEERLTLMRSKSEEMLRQLVEHGHRKPTEVAKRS